MKPISKAEKEELDRAWYDYCITNRLIAYGEVPPLTEEQIEAYCKERLEKDCEEIRRKYKMKRYFRGYAKEQAVIETIDHILLAYKTDITPNLKSKLTRWKNAIKEDLKKEYRE